MVSLFTGSQIVAGFVSGVVVLDEFANSSSQTYWIHCMAVAMVIVGIATLVHGESSYITNDAKMA